MAQAVDILNQSGVANATASEQQHGSTSWGGHGYDHEGDWRA